MAPKEPAAGVVTTPSAKADNSKEEAIRAEASRRDHAALFAIEAAMQAWQTADGGRQVKDRAEVEMVEAREIVEKKTALADNAIQKQKAAAAAVEDGKQKLALAKQATIDAQANARHVAHSTEAAAAALVEARVDVKQSVTATTVAEKAFVVVQEKLRSIQADLKWSKREAEKAESDASNTRATETTAKGARPTAISCTTPGAKRRLLLACSHTKKALSAATHHLEMISCGLISLRSPARPPPRSQRFVRGSARGSSPTLLHRQGAPLHMPRGCLLACPGLPAFASVRRGRCLLRGWV